MTNYNRIRTMSASSVEDVGDWDDKFNTPPYVERETKYAIESDDESIEKEEGFSSINMDDMSDVVGASTGHHAHKSVFHLMCLNVFALAYGCLIATFGIIVLPLESEHLFAENHAIMLGFFLALAGVSQLSGPIAGFFSDRCTHWLGRRRPFMLCGAVCGFLGLLVQWYSRVHVLPQLYFLAFFVSMLSLNIVYVAYSGALVDLVSPDQIGQANGIMGGFTVLGASLGFGAFTAILTVETCYPFFCAILLGSVCITSLFMNEIPIAGQKPWSWTEVSLCYYLSPSEHRDFFLVFLSRTQYYMAISVQTFMLFYFRDMIGVEDPKIAVAYLALVGQISGAVVCYPMGILSDKIGRKSLIYFSSFIIIVVYIQFMFTSTLFWALVGGALYGIGNGTYLAVDYALATDTLPSQEHAARFMGIWGVAAFVGTMVGPLIIGPMLVYFGEPTVIIENDSLQLQDQKYTPNGYIAIMTVGCLCMLGSALTVIKIQSAK